MSRALKPPPTLPEVLALWRKAGFVRIADAAVRLPPDCVRAFFEGVLLQADLARPHDFRSKLEKCAIAKTLVWLARS